MTLELYKDDLFCGNNCKALKSKFEIRLNPKDPEDEKILNCFDELIDLLQTPKWYEDDKIYKEFNDVRQELVERIALLLKHDWDRVKVESNSLSFFPKGVYFLTYLTCLMGVLFLLDKLCGTIDGFLGLWPFYLHEPYLEKIINIVSIICIGAFILIIIGWLIVLFRIASRMLKKGF